MRTFSINYKSGQILRIINVMDVSLIDIGISASKYSGKTDLITNFQAILQENHTCYALNGHRKATHSLKTAINRPARISAKGARNYRGKNLHSTERNLHFPRRQTRHQKSC